MARQRYLFNRGWRLGTLKETTSQFRGQVARQQPPRLGAEATILYSIMAAACLCSGRTLDPWMPASVPASQRTPGRFWLSWEMGSWRGTSAEFPTPDSRFSAD